ncbi:Phage-related baseplate assembly protein [Vibrio aerogenes CECT 7868]|uniref:Phage-related baseplate assembly protein n=1 Tax=Vibrio aerogenes CECT 7868 TaxID=1216006 RepID=A0A1M5Y4L0_9VIBR|nr:type VI secretion system tip protein VgrG [Vibrio aerogenes]SHI07010.1 Phage-related baseplate assembly protein [Vibrio aerogenes CECT 7868]
MAESPEKNSSGVTSLTIKADGNTIDSTTGIIAVHIYYQVNQVASAELTLSDGNVAEQTFEVSQGDAFKPGAKITISAGYAGDEETIFEGIVITHAIRITGNNQSSLHVTCKDQALGMTIARRSQSFLKQSDSDIISTLIGNCAGVSAEKVESIAEKHDELVQFHCSDWDFMLTRAEANGFVVCNQSGKISVAPPGVDKSPVLEVTYGTDLIDLSAAIDARHQLKQVTGTGWDPGQQKMLTGQTAAQSIADQGNLSDSELASVLGIGDFRLQTSATLTQDMLTSWAKGQRVKSMLAKVRGSVTFQGTADAKIDTLIQLTGVGERFNGSHYIGGVHHRIENGQWLTTVDLGLSPMWSAEHRDLGAPQAAGWLPPVDGLQIGLVTKLDEDPASQNRIQVQMPALGDDNNLVWARLSSYYATQTSGNFFIPEAGDEVVLGYINQDPGQPIVLGSLYSSQHTPPYSLTAENNTKAIVTKSQLKIEFNEEDKVTTILTPGGQSITLSDKEKSITLADQNSNTVTLNDSGISLESPKDIKLSAKGEISLESTNNSSIKAQMDVKIQGMNVDVQAQTGLTAKGSATAELSASGMTTIKGGLVKIN